MKRIKTNDKVIVVAGKSKGTVGVVTKIGVGRVVVQGANLVKKHVKPNPNVQEPGGIKEIEAPLHISNVALLNPVTNKPDRIGFKYIDGKDGVKTKVRYFKSNDELVDIA